MLVFKCSLVTDSQKSFAALALSGACLEQVHKRGNVFSVVFILNVIFVIIANNREITCTLMGEGRFGILFH